MKKIIFVFLMATIFYHCGMFNHREKEAVPLVKENEINIAYVKVKSEGDFSSIYRVSERELPVWCSTGKEYQKYIKGLSKYLSSENAVSTPMYVACYAGKKPRVVAETADVNINKTESNNIVFSYNPTEEFYIAGARVSTSCVQNMPVYYFTLYSEFCSGTDVKCCMNSDGSSFTIYAMFDSAFDANAMQNIKNFFDYIKNPVFSRDAQDNSYNLFLSYIQDKCSYNRWHYGVVSMGVLDPKSFLNKESWGAAFNSLKSCSLDIQKTVTLVVGQKP